MYPQKTAKLAGHAKSAKILAALGVASETRSAPGALQRAPGPHLQWGAMLQSMIGSITFAISRYIAVFVLS